MKIIGCDFHPSFQQIALVDTETGEHIEKRLNREEATIFDRGLCSPAVMASRPAGTRSGWNGCWRSWAMNCEWAMRAIRAMEVRKQKTDRRDAELLLKLLQEGSFPQVWVPSMEQRDTRQLLLHRHKLVSVRRQIKNQLQHLALNQGIQQKRKLWTLKGRELAARRHAAVDGRRRDDL